MRLPACFLLLLFARTGWADNWYPLATIADGKPFSYQALPSSSKPWRVCALLPHGKDRFWWGVAWGLAEEARRHNVKLGIYQAGGYENLALQRRQFAHCRERKADAILLATVSPSGLNREIDAAIQAKVVVIDLINGINDSNVTARAVSDTTELGVGAARYLLADAGSQAVEVAWFPGPEDAEWVANAEAGAMRTLKAAKASLIQGGHALPEITQQMTLVRNLFKHHTPDYVLGNAVAAEAAARFLRTRPELHTKVIAYWANEPVIAMIRNGEILAAPSNGGVLQARIGFDLALRALEGKPFPSSVKLAPEMLDATNIDQFQMDKLLAPANQWMIQQELPN